MRLTYRKSSVFCRVRLTQSFQQSITVYFNQLDHNVYCLLQTLLLNAISGEKFESDIQVTDDYGDDCDQDVLSRSFKLAHFTNKENQFLIPKVKLLLVLPAANTTRANSHVCNRVTKLELN